MADVLSSCLGRSYVILLDIQPAVSALFVLKPGHIRKWHSDSYACVCKILVGKFDGVMTILPGFVGKLDAGKAYR